MIFFFPLWDVFSFLFLLAFPLTKFNSFQQSSLQIFFQLCFLFRHLSGLLMYIIFFCPIACWGSEFLKSIFFWKILFLNYSWDRELARIPTSTDSLPAFPASEDGSWEINPGLPRGDIWAISCCLSKCTLAGSWNQDQTWELNPGTLIIVCRHPNHYFNC